MLPEKSHSPKNLTIVQNVFMVWKLSTSHYRNADSWTNFIIFKYFIHNQRVPLIYIYILLAKDGIT